MIVVDFSMRAAPWCGACSRPGQGISISYASEVAAQLPRPGGHVSSLVGSAESGQSEGVHKVHTSGFGSDRTGAGLGRIAGVCGGVADIQGREDGSSPTSGTVFPQVKGLFGP